MLLDACCFLQLPRILSAPLVEAEHLLLLLKKLGMRAQQIGSDAAFPVYFRILIEISDAVAR